MKNLLLIFFLLLIFCLSCKAEDSKEVNLGGIFDLSSVAGVQWGTAERNGFLLAIKEFKSKHPEWDVNAIIEDSGYSNQKSVTALNKLISVDKVKYVMGPTWEPFVATQPICEKKGIICIATSCNNGYFDKDGKGFTYTVWFDEREYSRVHARYINRKGYKNIAVISAISPYYDAVVDAFIDTLNNKPTFVERIQSDNRDFRSIITKTPKNIEAMMVFLLGDGASQNFYRQWAELRSDRPEIFTDDTVLYFDPPLDVKKLGHNIFYSEPDFSTGSLAAFESNYLKEFKLKPSSPSASTAYDGTTMLLRCIQKSHPDSSKVRDCIASTENFKGASGILSFKGKRSIQERSMSLKKLG